MNTLVVILASVWVLTILGYVIYNLYSKNVKLEKSVIDQSDFIQSMLSCMTELDKAVDQIDSKIWVQSDPEILVMFDKVKQIQALIKEFQKV